MRKKFRGIPIVYTTPEAEGKFNTVAQATVDYAGNPIIKVLRPEEFEKKHLEHEYTHILRGDHKTHKTISTSEEMGREEVSVERETNRRLYGNDKLTPEQAAYIIQQNLAEVDSIQTVNRIARAMRDNPDLRLGLTLEEINDGVAYLQLQYLQG